MPGKKRPRPTDPAPIVVGCIDEHAARKFHNHLRYEAELTGTIQDGRLVKILTAPPGSYRWDAIRAAQAAVLAELDVAQAAIQRVRDYCHDQTVQAVDGGLANADSIWPTDVLRVIDADTTGEGA